LQGFYGAAPAPETLFGGLNAFVGWKNITMFETTNQGKMYEREN